MSVKEKMEWNIDSIDDMTEEMAKEIAIESMEIKGHNIYFVDFGDRFGYSKLVFKNGHHIYHANDYELHHRGNSWCKGKTREELREWYIQGANNILFTEEELGEPLKDYQEYSRKRHFLHNYYGMQVDYVSIFCCNPTEQQQKEFEKKTKDMIYNPIAFAYMSDAEFVKHHIELLNILEKAKEDTDNNYEYLKNAYLYEMHNHEYGINWQADYDTLSAFGNIQYHGGDMNAYFEELNFTELQKQAYLDARKQYFKETENYSSKRTSVRLQGFAPLY